LFLLNLSVTRQGLVDLLASAEFGSQDSLIQLCKLESSQEIRIFLGLYQIWK